MTATTRLAAMTAIVLVVGCARPPASPMATTGPNQAVFSVPTMT